jgi:hypothetical protein
MDFHYCLSEGAVSATDCNMPVALDKSVRELGRTQLVRDAIEDAKKVLRANNESFNQQPGGVNDTSSLWPELDAIFKKFFGDGYDGPRHLSKYTGMFTHQTSNINP